MSESNNAFSFESVDNQSQSISCPRCGSHHIYTKHFGKRLGGAIGTCAGIAASLSSASKGSIAGASLAYRFSPPIPQVRLTSAVLGAFTGGVTGCIAGARLGQTIDALVLNNHQCLSCDYSFQA